MKSHQTNDTNFKLEKYYHQIDGDIYEIIRKVPLTSLDHINISGVDASHDSKSKSNPHQHQQQPLTQQTEQTIKSIKNVKNHTKNGSELTRKKILTRQHSQKQPLQLRDSVNTIRPEKPQPPLRASSRSKSSEIDYINAPQRLNEMLKIDVSNECFNRSQRQRHSSRSVGGFDNRDSEFNAHKNAIHQRHSSGPSELITQKDESTDWIINLPHRANDDGNRKEIRISQALKDELLQILQQKKTLQRKDSGLGNAQDYARLQNNIIEWIKSQHTSKNLQISSVKDDAKNVKTFKNEQYAVPRKRHSFGQTENVKSIQNTNNMYNNIPTNAIQHTMSMINNTNNNNIGDWNHMMTPATINMTTTMASATTTIASAATPVTNQRITDTDRIRLDNTDTNNDDISNNCKLDRNIDYRHEQPKPHSTKLRHSASEVVTSVRAKNDQIIGGASKHYTSKQNSTPKRERYHYIFKTPSMSIDQNPDQSNRSSKRDRPRRNHTQRSATVSDMLSNSHNNNNINTITNNNNTINRIQRKQSSIERESSHSSSITKCTDPMCALLPICTNPNCRLNDCYNTRRYSSLTRCGETKCTSECFQYQSLPECMDPKCLCRSRYATNIKHNSLPKCVSAHRSSEHDSSFPRKHRSRNNSKSGKLVKSASAASLNSRRRRHKTVHFGENLLRDVCQNRKLIEPLQKIPSEKSTTMQSNIQMLYNFVEGVLSAWVDEDDDTIRSGAESEPERGRLLKPIYLCDRLRLQTIKRVVSEAAQLRGTLKLGNSRYRHRHWRGTAKECNERFLQKVTILISFTSNITLLRYYDIMNI